MSGDEVWADEPPTTRRKWRDPAEGTDSAGLLARLRAQPGRYLRVAEEVPLGWWWRPESAPLRDLRSRRLVVSLTEPVRGFRSHVWARALTPDERESERTIEAVT